MEGPTPVSALIHAATMVNAGVYMVARSNPIFAEAPTAMLVVATIGTFTAIFAAAIALTQNDIKKVLAYSTVSQLAYMFLALGIGAWVAAIFHLVAHGFFKGLLFMGSGSVIHGAGGEQDMRYMGNLRERMRWTYVTMVIGSLALSGIPIFAGFFSKDEILAEAFKRGYFVFYAVGVVVAFMTAFYTFRMIFMTFWGEWRGPRAIWDHVHESAPTMVTPLVILSVPTALAGLLLGIPPEGGVIHPGSRRSSLARRRPVRASNPARSPRRATRTSSSSDPAASCWAPGRWSPSWACGSPTAGTCGRRRPQRASSSASRSASGPGCTAPASTSTTSTMSTSSPSPAAAL